MGPLEFRTGTLIFNGFKQFSIIYISCFVFYDRLVGTVDVLIVFAIKMPLDDFRTVV